MDSEVIRAVDLADKRWIFKITKVAQGTITGSGAKKTKRPVCTLEGQTKPLVVNAGMGTTIATLYGTDHEGWVDKWIEIYAAPTTFGGQPVMGIRVSPKAPEPVAKAGKVQT